ncbi:MAG: T9SS type A sorting domain-containing protein, partial [Cyclobacteriaceae bacterium]|nr:T9SS type A sorting domain-containing protein [Cyclobacteriaceae bacterium]
ALDSIVVEQNELYSEAFITQKNDTLFANDDRANWFRNDSFLQKTGLYLIPEESGLYYISINNEYGCLSTSENMYFGITGLEELNKEITLFPNPFNEFIRVSNSKGLLEFVKIFDMQGALISENYNIKNKFIDIYLSGSSNGIYLIKIRKDGKLLTWKVVKNLSK